jgi:hypothetical protein
MSVAGIGVRDRGLLRRCVFTAIAATLAMAVALSSGAAVGFAKTETREAAYYEDDLGNLCVGLATSGLYTGSCEWGGMTGSANVGVGLDVLAHDSSGGGNSASGTEALYSNTSGFRNVASGAFALKENTTGSGNTATGFRALLSNTEGNLNTASGVKALLANTGGGSNTASGAFALFANTTGSANTASGYFALEKNSTGEGNTASGDEALLNATGSANVAVGYRAGRELTSGSDNVDIANAGNAAESGTTRIGSEGKQTRAFVAGVYKSPVGSTACAVKASPEGQLGCNEEGSAVATFSALKAKTLSGQCLAYTGIGPAGSGACAAKTTGFSSSTRLAPMPGNGGEVSDLYADSSATVAGSDTVAVEVIDDTTGAKLIGCTLTSSSPHSCSNTSEAGSAAAGDNVEVKVTANGASGNEKAWRVTFRF